MPKFIRVRLSRLPVSLSVLVISWLGQEHNFRAVVAARLNLLGKAHSVLDAAEFHGMHVFRIGSLLTLRP